jgi:polar amino acid transport system substrate-binding protein
MKKLYKVTLIPILFVLCAASVAFSGEVIDRIQKRGYIIIGTSTTQPPLSMAKKNGEPFGLDVDLSSIVAAAMGVKLDLRTMPFAELLPALERGKIDIIISGMTMRPQSNLKVAFVGPYFISGTGILTKKASVEKTKSISKLNNKDITLAALKKSTSQKLIEQRIPLAKLHTYEDIEDAVLALVNDDVDAMIAEYHSCVAYAMRYQDEGFVAGSAKYTFEPLGIAMPPNDPLLVNWFHNLLVYLQGSGDLTVLTERWLKNDSWVELLP